MKKFWLCFILYIIILSIIFSGCSTYNKINNDGRLTVIYNDGWALIYKDNETGVQYLSRSNQGTCVMVDSNGKPYTGK